METPADLSLTGDCDALGFEAALSLAAADWLPPLIDLSEVLGVVEAAERSCVVADLFCAPDVLLSAVEGRL